jgi:hypothetical protein
MATKSKVLTLKQRRLAAEIENTQMLRILKSIITPEQEHQARELFTQWHKDNWAIVKHQLKLN